MPTQPSRPTLGPYEVIRPLGSGGMGEVLLAYDPRLDRRVAIKRLRPGVPLDDARRARLRREARLAARLNHPAIVQVFDFLTAGDDEHIVMEYVAGISLRQRLEAGPPPFVETLAVARAVAEGLAYAHRQGVLHRDLKTENILLPEEGGAKITDFGIARRLLAGDDGGETLTREGVVVGTARAMSPEQACGDPIDERSDLFSLGTLLYETFTGRSPFQGEGNLETVRRVLHHRPPALRELAPELPPDLGELVGGLLEKEPGLRPGSAGEVAERLRGIAGEGSGDATVATVVEGSPAPEPTPATTPAAPPPPGRRHRWWRPAALAAGGILGIAVAVTLAIALARPAPPRYVAVLRPQIQDPGAVPEETALLAFALRSALLRALVSLEGLSPKTPAEVDAVAGPPSAVARAVAADELITTSLLCHAGGCLVEVSRVRGVDGGVLWSDQLRVGRDDPLVAARALTLKLRQGYPEQQPRPGMATLEATPEDYAAYLDIQRTFSADPRRAGLAELMQRLAALRGRSDRFVEAYLLEAELAARRFLETRDGAPRDRAFDLLEQARQLAPGDPEVLSKRFYVEIATGHLAAAQETLDEMERLLPGDVRLLDKRAELLARRGQPEQALEMYRAAVARQPSWERLYNLASLAYRQGRIEVARRGIAELLELSPENYEGLSLLAELELVNGDPGRAAELYGALVERSPRVWELSNLGLAHLLLGDPGAAAAAFERAVEAAPNHPIWNLNLADARALQGRREEAAALYERTLALLDSDPEPAQGGGAQLLSTRAQALAHLGRHREAVAAVQEALRRAPESGQAAFDAALVHTLAGDLTAALVHAERALELGYQRRWFRLPWFEPLRARPEFRQLLADGAAP